MAYETASVAELTRRMVTERPGISMAAVERAAQVERHTITRALRERFGVSFRELKSRCLAARSEELLCGVGPRSVKQVAHELGYNSVRAFAKRVKCVHGLAPSVLRRRAK